MARFLVTAFCVFGLSVAVLWRPLPARAADAPSDDIPIELTSDEVTYDRDLGVITASGNVEITQEKRTLLADTITYNQKQDLITASGHITLLEPSGEVIFGDSMELSGDMRDGIIKGLAIILQDHSRIVANGARRSNANIMEMRKAVYSPCKSCEEDPSRPVLWQIKAVKVVHDKSRQTIEYSDAWLEIAGVPVAYTPYLTHPDPTVKRRSGFLAPSLGSSSDLGFTLRTPYFYNIDPHSDFTFSPILMANETPVIAGEYRRRMDKGELDTKASVTYDSEKELRGHVASKGRFNIDDTWRWGFDINRAIDDTYTRRFGFTGDNTMPNSNDSLTTHLFTEGFRKRNYMAFNTYAFQDLKTDANRGDTPYVLPMLDFNHVGEPGPLGGQTNLDVSLLAITRTANMDSRRLSVKAGWQAPYTSPLGDSYKLSASLKGDLYHVNGLERQDKADKFNGFSGRVLPELRLDWRYPFVRSEGDSRQIIEPIAAAIVSPYGGNSTKIPNEDSIDFEFDDTNLFSSNRFTGHDRVESGPRINYGLKWGLYGKGGGSSSLMIGQSFRVRDDDAFPLDSGLEDNFSDFVTMVDISPGSYLNLVHRSRFSKESLKVHRNELNLSTGIPAFRLDTNYVFFDHQRDAEFVGREEVSVSLSSQINRLWRGNISGVRDLTGRGTMRSFGLNLTYEDECFLMASDLTRTFFEDRDLEPTDAIMFRVMFKTLGEVASGITKSQ